MKFFKWIKWLVWDSRRCKHSLLDERHSQLYDVGKSKGWWCKKCGKLLYYI